MTTLLIPKTMQVNYKNYFWYKDEDQILRQCKVCFKYCLEMRFYPECRRN